MDKIFLVQSIITQSFGIFKKKAVEPPPPPISAATKNFLFAFLAELGDLESYETNFFFWKKIPKFFLTLVIFQKIWNFFLLFFVELDIPEAFKSNIRRKKAKKKLEIFFQKKKVGLIWFQIA